MPFPGGIARSGSKVGSKYKGASASTNDLYCPTLKGAVDSALSPEIASVLEIVIDGLTSEAVARGDASGACRDHRTGPRARRVARRRGQLRRQARPAPLSSQGSPPLSPMTFSLREAPDQRLDLSPLICAKSRGQDGRGDRTYRAGNNAHARDGGRRFPHPRRRSRHNCHRRRQRAFRSRRHGHDLGLHPRRRGGRRRSRAHDVGRTIDHSRRRGPVRGFRNEGRNARTSRATRASGSAAR